MVKCKVDLLAIDSAHGHSTRVLDAIKMVKSKLPEVDLIAGTSGPSTEPANWLEPAPMPSRSVLARDPSAPPGW